MTLQTLASLLVAATIMGPPSAAFGAGSPPLSPEQDKTAACMLSVVHAEKDVTDVKLTVQAGAEMSGAPDRRPHVFIAYTFKHRFDSSGVLHPYVVTKTPVHWEITQLLPPVAQPFTMIGLSGISPKPAPGDDWTNDHNDGLWEIIPRWNRKCGVPIGAMTI